MIPEPASLNVKTVSASLSFAAAPRLSAFLLSNLEQAQVLDFLAQRAIHNVVMSGFIRDNGIESELNRGRFYGSRNAAGMLEGIALIGHTTLIDARSETVIEAFATIARAYRQAHVIVGEQKSIARFWDLYAGGGQPARHFCREVLFELNEVKETCDSAPDLRCATLDDLSMIVPVHAALACEESGVDPLLADTDGFHARCRRRIEKGRVWVQVKRGELIFKADVISDTPEAIYLEGIYVHPEYRGQGNGSRCLVQMTQQLLRRTRSVTALVNTERQPAQRFFQKLGFVSRGLYDTIFLQTPTAYQHSK
jgi:uncharacterized protein